MNFHNQKSKLYKESSTGLRQGFLWTRLQSNRESWNVSIQKILIRIGILIFLIIFLNIFQTQIKESFYSVVYPLSKNFLANSKNTAGFLNSFAYFKELQKENNILKQENQNLLSRVVLLENNLAENRVFKEALQNTKDDNFELVLANTIGFDTFSDFILLNKGSDDGVFENMPVISNQKVLYGKIFKV